MATTVPSHPQPSPELLFETLLAFQRTEALKAAIELDFFTAIGEDNNTAAGVARRCQVSERGARTLCDILTVIGFLHKQDGKYALTPDSAMFLDRRSPACAASIVKFLASPDLIGNYNNLPAAVRKGQTVAEQGGTVAPENPLWVEFARSMAPLATMTSGLIAKLLVRENLSPKKVLDIAAGHGLFGIAIAQQFPAADITALDWANVLEVAKENAAKAGVAARHNTLPGSAFDVNFGAGYDMVLLTNFLHHFDIPTCESLLRKVRTALAPGGHCVTLEFVPNEDRVTPPCSA